MQNGNQVSLLQATIEITKKTKWALSNKTNKTGLHVYKNIQQ